MVDLNPLPLFPFKRGEGGGGGGGGGGGEELAKKLALAKL